MAYGNDITNISICYRKISPGINLAVINLKILIQYVKTG